MDLCIVEVGGAQVQSLRLIAPPQAKIAKFVNNHVNSVVNVLVSMTYSISDLAREFDLTTRAIRFYEDLGLLQPQRLGSGGRHRVYTARDRARLKLTLRAKRLGLSLTEAKEIIDMYDSPRDTGAQLKKFLAVLGDHRKQLDGQMADLQANLDELKLHEKEARALLARTEKVRA